jgi:hypothetical protein
MSDDFYLCRVRFFFSICAACSPVLVTMGLLSHKATSNAT